jgi:hypothetical protein
MDDKIVTGIFTIVGIVIGAVLTWITNYSKEKRDRKDRYFFALLDKRVNVYQQAFSNVEKLKEVVHGDEAKRIEVVNDALDWFNNNNLYLEPQLRKDFRRTISQVSMYQFQLEDWKTTARTEGQDTEKTKKKRDKLESTFENIVEGIQDRIQKDIDLYYKYLK